MISGADPDQLADQLASSEPTDLDLHCLQRQGISRFSRTRVKFCKRHRALNEQSLYLISI